LRGLVVSRADFAFSFVFLDYPNSTKAKKHYLVLSFDRTYKAPAGLTDGALLASKNSRDQVRVDDTTIGKGKKGKMHRKKKGSKTKEWIIQKKGIQRRQGKDVRPDTKYTGRKRKDKF